jgi:N-acyl-phosphatidylethanolamine-hydrolysing phospholipase D
MQDHNNRIKSLKKRGRFINGFVNQRIRRTIKDFIKWKRGKFKEEIKISIPVSFKYPAKNQIFNENLDYVSWIGHDTFLIKTKNFHLLTDPIFNKKCSPISFIGPSRKIDPAIKAINLPKIDYITISHDHYDHLDKKSVILLNKLYPNVKFIVPLGIKKWLRKRGVLNTIELDWWEAYEDEKIKITSVPAQHYSGRGLFDGNLRLWCGFVMENKENNKKIYFTGDTGYNNRNFKLIKDKFNEIDLSLIPIGTYVPREFMLPVHTDPINAIKIHKDVNSKLSIAMHHKTFKLSEEDINLPPYELFINLQKENIDPLRFLAIDPGEFLNF